MRLIEKFSWKITAIANSVHDMEMHHINMNWITTNYYTVIIIDAIITVMLIVV